MKRVKGDLPRKGKKEEPFDGFEFTELAERWELDIPEDADDEQVRQHMRDYLWSALKDRKLEKRTAADIRDFLAVLAAESRKSDYAWPVWEAIRGIKHDETVVKFTIYLLEHMWT